MKTITEGGEEILLVDGVRHHDESTGHFGITKAQIARIAERGQNVKLAQFVHLVDPGLVLANPVFQGANRPLCYGENLEGDKDKLFYCWSPMFDYKWERKDRFDESKIISVGAPEKKIFVVIATPNQLKEKFPSVDYWIERWCWVEESIDPGHPIDWRSRYTTKVKPV